jgi:hypothetical protein
MEEDIEPKKKNANHNCGGEIGGGDSGIQG